MKSGIPLAQMILPCNYHRVSDVPGLFVKMDDAQITIFINVFNVSLTAHICVAMVQIVP